MKKLISVLLLVAMMVAFGAACGVQDAQEAAETTQSDPAETMETAAEETESATEGSESYHAAEDTAEGDADTAGAADTSKVAAAEDMTDVIDVVREDMTPIYADSLVDGVYPIAVDCSSSMFNIESCVLVVSDGEMNAILKMGSTAYLYLFAGSAEEAASADASAFIEPTENNDETYSFTIPVEALDAGVACAAFSRRKEMWYDRTLVFRADSLPLDAFAEGVIITAEELGLVDGEYSVEVTLAGGSGKASVQSPARLYVENGQCTAEIVWSSSKYDYMRVQDEQYFPVNEEGNSTFVIPVLGFDFKMPVSADTTAMSQPHEIDYTLCFDSASIGEPLS